MSETTETGWLIERLSPPEWYAGGPCTRWQWRHEIDAPDLWTTDASKALRFARKQDAETLIHFEGYIGAIATEHQWCNKP